MNQSNLPQYAHDPIYKELVSLCEQCGIAIEYTNAGDDYYARTNQKIIQMGPDSAYRNAEHAAIVLGHELAHTLQEHYYLSRKDLAEYGIAPYPNDDDEDLCDCWGVALYKLASLIYGKKIGD